MRQSARSAGGRAWPGTLSRKRRGLAALDSRPDPAIPQGMRLSTTSLCLALLLVGCGDDKGGVTDTTSGPDTSSTGSADTTGPTSEPTTTTATTAATSDSSLASDVTLAETSVTSSTTDTTDGTTTSDATGASSATTSGTDTTDGTGTTSGTDTTDASSSTGGGGLGEDEVCQDDPDGCAPGLLCCYPCGVPDCLNKCIKPDPNTQMCPLFP